MGTSSKRLRPLLTLILVGAGTAVGGSLASYVRIFLDNSLDSANWGPIPITPRPLVKGEVIGLYLVFCMVGALLGFVVERVAFIQSRKAHARWENMAPQDKFVVMGGVVLGLVLTALLQTILRTTLWVNVLSALTLCYMCIFALESLKEQVRFYFPSPASMSKSEHNFTNRPKLLDTNVIIDGRIADVCRAGFVEGPIYVPKFVLEELQQIADSSDSLKRARGRRGLEILKQMQTEMDLQVPNLAADDSSEEVDARLVIVAREIGGAIITNDYNLNKVAELQGVDVLNVNELANALKPVVLPGEEMRVTVIKEGKEKEQGIGYLDDGTMIVVEGARRMIGDTLEVSVTSVLQTVQGKMIFARIREDSEETYNASDGSVRSYPGGRPRRKIR